MSSHGRATEERAQLVADDEQQPTGLEPTAAARSKRSKRCPRCRRMARGSCATVLLLAVIGSMKQFFQVDRGTRTSTNSAIDADGAQVHMLLLEADQVRPDAHGAAVPSAGRLTAVTTNLDGIASEGVRFVSAYSTTPICTPARLALLTGRSAIRHGMRYYGKVPHASQSAMRMELVSTMAAHGYHTSIVGKNHYGTEPDGLRFDLHGYAESQIYEGLLDYDGRQHGRQPSFVRLDDYGAWFNHSCPGCDPLATTASQKSPWRNVTGATPYNSNEPFAYPYPEHLHPTRWTADAAIKSFERWLTRRQAGESRPLFLKVSFHRPHSPYDPPERWLRYMLDRADRVAEPATGDWSDVQYAEGGDCTASQRRYCGSSCGFQSYCGRLASDDLRVVRAAYLASHSFVDEQAGRLLTRMRAEAEWRETFVIYLSDHGDALGDHVHAPACTQAWRTRSVPSHSHTLDRFAVVRTCGEKAIRMSRWHQSRSTFVGPTRGIPRVQLTLPVGSRVAHRFRTLLLCMTSSRRWQTRLGSRCRRGGRKKLRRTALRCCRFSGKVPTEPRGVM